MSCIPSEENVLEIKNWISSEDSVPNLTDRDIKRYLFKNNCDIDQTKKSIVDNYEFRSQNLKYFADRDVHLDNLEVASRLIGVYKLNGTTTEGYKVILITYLSKDPTEFVFEDILKCVFMSADMIVNEDPNPYSEYIFVLDRSNFTAAHVFKVHTQGLYMFSKYFDVAFKGCISKIMKINTSIMSRFFVLFSFVWTFGILRKLLVSYGWGDKNYLKIIPRSMMPIDLDGTGPEMSKMHEDLLKQLKNYEENFQEEDEFVKKLSKNSNYPSKMFGFSFFS